jgi:hypothetical protein
MGLLKGSRLAGRSGAFTGVLTGAVVVDIFCPPNIQRTRTDGLKKEEGIFSLLFYFEFKLIF